MLPSMETLLILAVASWAELQNVCFPGLFALKFSLTVPVPPLWTLSAAIHCAEVLYPNLLTCTTHVCIFNVEIWLNIRHRYIFSREFSYLNITFFM